MINFYFDEEEEPDLKTYDENEEEQDSFDEILSLAQLRNKKRRLQRQKKKRAEYRLDNLQHDYIVKICLFLDIDSIMQLQSVNPQLKNLILKTWKSRLLHDFPSVYSILKGEDYEPSVYLRVYNLQLRPQSEKPTLDKNLDRCSQIIEKLYKDLVSHLIDMMDFSEDIPNTVQYLIKKITIYVSHFPEQNTVKFWTQGLLTNLTIVLEYKFPISERLIKWGDIGQQSYYFVTEIESIQQVLYVFTYKNIDYTRRKQYLTKVIIPFECDLQKYVKRTKITNVVDCGRFAIAVDQSTIILLNSVIDIKFATLFDNCQFDEDTQILTFKIEDLEHICIVAISVESNTVLHQSLTKLSQFELEPSRELLIDVLTLKDSQGKKLVYLLQRDRIGCLAYDNDETKPPAKSLINLGFEFQAKGFFKFKDATSQGKTKIAVWGHGLLKIMDPDDAKVETIKYTQSITKLVTTRTHYIIFSEFPSQFSRFYVCTQSINNHPRNVFQSSESALQMHKYEKWGTPQCDNYDTLYNATMLRSYQHYNYSCTLYKNSRILQAEHKHSFLKHTGHLKTKICNDKILHLFGENLYRDRKIAFSDVTAEKNLVNYGQLYGLEETFSQTIPVIPVATTEDTPKKQIECIGIDEFLLRKKAHKIKETIPKKRKILHLDKDQKKSVRKYLNEKVGL